MDYMAVLAKSEVVVVPVRRLQYVVVIIVMNGLNIIHVGGRNC